MLAAELLSRILLGSDSFADPQVSDDVLRHQGDTFLVFRGRPVPALLDLCPAGPTGCSSGVRAVPAAPGFDRVRVPGDPEVETQARREREGIPIAEDVWQRVVETTESLEIDEC